MPMPERRNDASSFDLEAARLELVDKSLDRLCGPLKEIPMSLYIANDLF
jgi:hypothetical protein